MSIPAEALASLRNGSPPDEQDIPAPGYGLTVPVIASALLEVAVTHARAAGCRVPERTMVVASGPRDVAWDCEQITVTLAGIGWGASPSASPGPVPAEELQRTLRHVVFELAWVRRGVVPDANASATAAMLPAAADVHAEGLAAMQAAGVLSEAVLQAASRLEQGLVQAGDLVQTGTVEILGPQGGYYALVTGLTVTLGDRA